MRKAILYICLSIIIFLAGIIFVYLWVGSTTAGSQLSISMGTPSMSMVTLEYGSGKTVFPGFEVIQVTLQSRRSLPVNLSVSGVPSDIWIYFQPSYLISGPQGSVAHMIIAGAIASSDSLQAKTLILKANYPSGSTGIPFSVIDQDLNISIIQKPAPLQFISPIVMTPNGSVAKIFGAVYAPSLSIVTALQISLSINGWFYKGEIRPLPQGLNVQIVNSSMLLIPYEPTYFLVAANSTSMSLGAYSIRIQETVAGLVFESQIQVIVHEPVRS